MTLKQALEIQKILGKTIPVDMYDIYEYYSESKEEWVDIAEMDLVHAIRVLRKYVGKRLTNKQLSSKIYRYDKV
tara:strand:+ start:940 stop:1161 length:222 start_codon:yes stop_codon:yes gene_type:complete